MQSKKETRMTGPAQLIVRNIPLLLTTIEKFPLQQPGGELGTTPTSHPCRETSGYCCNFATSVLAEERVANNKLPGSCPISPHGNMPRNCGKIFLLYIPAGNVARNCCKALVWYPRRELAKKFGQDSCLISPPGTYQEIGARFLLISPPGTWRG